MRTKVGTIEQLREAYAYGIQSKKKGFERVSPYYEQPTLDKYYFDGYDGKPFEGSEEK